MRRRLILLIFLLMLTGCTKLDNNIESIVNEWLDNENQIDYTEDSKLYSDSQKCYHPDKLK